MNLHFLGHSAAQLTDGDTTVLVDPFLTGNPKAAVAADDVQADAIPLTHGHVDHIGVGGPGAQLVDRDVRRVRRSRD